MEQGNNKSAVGVIIALVILIAVGVGIYALTQNDDTEETATNETVQQDPVSEVEEEPAPPSQNVVETAQATPQLSTLVDAVVAADLVETLSGEGPFTVFAPTNDAFAAAIEELDTTAEDLLAREDLADILTYHVVSGAVLSTDLSDGQVVTTVQGNDLTVRVTDEGVMLEDALGRMAMVTAPDIEVSNGVVHLIDNVVLPQ